jgi:hypothetical protein
LEIIGNAWNRFEKPLESFGMTFGIDRKRPEVSLPRSASCPNSQRVDNPGAFARFELGMLEACPATPGLDVGRLELSPRPLSLVARAALTRTQVP